MKTNQLTAVIPTLGNKNISKLLSKLVKNDLIKEVLISVPNSNKGKIYKYKNKKVKIIYSDFKHQVKQRILCYKKIKTKLTILLDDDIDFNNNFISNLVKIKLQKGNNSVIGPVYYNKKNLKKIHSNDLNFKNIFKRFLQSIFLGISFTKNRMGKISKAGNCYGVDPDYMEEDFIKVDWIPGGCMIVSTNKLIHKNYFNIVGKAYCEDLIQSFLFRKKKLTLYIYKKTKLYTDPPQKLTSREDIKNYLNGHKLFCNYIKLYNFRVNIWRAYLSFKL